MLARIPSLVVFFLCFFGGGVVFAESVHPTPVAKEALRALDKKCADFERQSDEVLSRYSKLGRFSGTVLVVKDGVVLLRKGYGLADAKKKTKNGPATKFRIGSVTKQF